MAENTPAIFYRRNEAEESIFQEYCTQHDIKNIIDEYGEAQKELINLSDPSHLFVLEKEEPYQDKTMGVWICFPWKYTVVHTLEKNDYNAVRLSRNDDLITKEEQELLSTKRIAIAGLNVGNPAAVCMVQEGVGGEFKFADNDALGLSNLNRFRAGLCEIGLNKAILSARQAYEIDPYAKIEILPNGISKENLSEFLDGADVFVEEMDNLPLKIIAREAAREKGIPTIMVTGNGGGLILDIERFDTDPDLELLSGNLPEAVRSAIFQGPVSPQKKLILARDFMGEGNLVTRLYDSFEKVGKTIIGIPQISEASFLRGAVLTNVARAILLEQPVASGRYTIQLSDIWKKE